MISLFEMLQINNGIFISKNDAPYVIPLSFVGPSEFPYLSFYEKEDYFSLYQDRGKINVRNYFEGIKPYQIVFDRSDDLYKINPDLQGRLYEFENCYILVPDGWN